MVVYIQSSQACVSEQINLVLLAGVVRLVQAMVEQFNNDRRV